MHIPLPIVALVQKAISQTLPLDPDTQRALGAIDGKVIAIEVQQPPIEFWLSIVDRDIQLMGVFDGEPDTKLNGPLTDFIAMQSSSSVLDSGRVVVSGDEALAKQFALIVYRSEVDWQDAIAPFVGETLAHKLGEFVKGLGLWAGSTSSHLREDTAEYLQEETDVLVARNQVNSFAKQVEAAVSAVDALDKKLSALESRS